MTQTGTVSPPDAVEISGLATSRSYQGGLWVHNDSGDSARVFGLNPTGTLHTQLEMDGIDAVDFEDMAMGVNAYGEPTIVLADIGDNAKKRAQVVLYQFDEPRWETASPTQRITDISTFPLTYPDGAHDAEALLYDPVTDVFVIVTKSLSGESHIYSIGRSQLGNQNVLEKKGTLMIGTPPLIGGTTVTGGDVGPNGHYIALQTYTSLSGNARQRLLGHDAEGCIVTPESSPKAKHWACSLRYRFVLHQRRTKPTHFQISSVHYWV